jgi:hypothetical protein
MTVPLVIKYGTGVVITVGVPNLLGVDVGGGGVVGGGVVGGGVGGDGVGGGGDTEEDGGVCASSATTA